MKEPELVIEEEESPKEDEEKKKAKEEQKKTPSPYRPPIHYPQILKAKQDEQYSNFLSFSNNYILTYNLLIL